MMKTKWENLFPVAPLLLVLFIIPQSVCWGTVDVNTEITHPVLDRTVFKWTFTVPESDSIASVHITGQKITTQENRGEISPPGWTFRGDILDGDFHWDRELPNETNTTLAFIVVIDENFNATAASSVTYDYFDAQNKRQDIDIPEPEGSWGNEWGLVPVPEPMTICLLGLGALALRHRKRRP